ncbi:uncharacterized protein UV8b_08169 [Ustilaginoidea virens]|uniref:Uncharacterized protein n=1 Tax=Ustilaginoidea virens TaxID=1159556 RepID=A0A8E5MKQ8_USTVR|nr:uncharacterized protein UV8b_08169 [Ustilaginoidea virens]QUC23928.1 hypothetical protein UV8b_08169 [Ustilaginoidea virens]
MSSCPDNGQVPRFPGTSLPSTPLDLGVSSLFRLSSALALLALDAVSRWFVVLGQVSRRTTNEVKHGQYQTR